MYTKENFKNSIIDLVLSYSKKKNISYLESLNEFTSEINNRINFLNRGKEELEQNVNQINSIDNETSSKIDIVVLQYVANSGIRYLETLLDFKTVLNDVKNSEINMPKKKKAITTEGHQVKISLEQLLRLLIKSIETNEPYLRLIDDCKALKMNQIAYINFLNDPLFNNGYNFVFECDINEQVRLEIIEIDSKLLQTGFQIIYKSTFFNFKIKKNLIDIRKTLKEYYHNEFLQNIQGTIAYNYANDLSQCYVSKSKMNDKWILNFNILNRTNSEIANFKSPLMNN